MEGLLILLTQSGKHGDKHVSLDVKPKNNAKPIGWRITWLVSLGGWGSS